MAMVSTVLFLATINLSIPLDKSPAYYFYQGDLAMSMGQWHRAIELFEHAVSIENISESAQAMAYWNMHIAYENIDDTNGAPTSLLGFIVHSLGYLDFLKSLDEPDRKKHPGTRWMRQYKIQNKLKRAAYKLQWYWEHSRHAESTSNVCTDCERQRSQK